MIFIERTSWALYAPYADPIIVIALVVASAPLPISVIRNNLREVLLAAPEPDFQQRVREKLKTATHDLPVDHTILRMVKVGRTLYLLIYLVVSESARSAVVNDLDAVRERIATELGAAFPELAVDVVFTTNVKWAHPSTGLASS